MTALKRSGWVLAAIFCLGLFLRLHQFGQVPVSLYWDEMAIWNDARSIAETGRDLFNRPWFQPIFISYGDYKLPVYIWAVSLASRFTTHPMIAVRLPSLFAGLSMIPGVYLLARFLKAPLKQSESINKTFALFSAFFLAILPWSLQFSREGFEGHLSAAFLLWSAVALLWSLQPKRRWWYAALSGLLGTVAVYTYFSTRFVWPVVIIVLSALVVGKKLSSWRGPVLAVVLWLFLLIPMYRADFYQASNQFRLSAANILSQPDQANIINGYRLRAGNTLLSRVIYSRTTFVAKDLGLNYLAYLDPGYLFLHGDNNLRHSTGQVGLMLPLLAPAFLFGIALFAAKERRVGGTLLLWWAAAVLPAAVPLDVPHALRSLNALPIFPLVIALGTLGLWQWWQSKVSRKQLFFWSVPLFVALWLLASIIRNEYIFSTIYPTVSADEWQDGYTQLAQYIQQNLQSHYDYVYVDSFDERFYLYYQPYSSLSYKEIQQLPSRDFKRYIFKNVRIRNIDNWQALENNSVVVTTPSRLPAGWKVKDTVKGASGKEYFVVVETRRL